MPPGLYMQKLTLFPWYSSVKCFKRAEKWTFIVIQLLALAFWLGHCKISSCYTQYQVPLIKGWFCTLYTGWAYANISSLGSQLGEYNLCPFLREENQFSEPKFNKTLRMGLWNITVRVLIKIFQLLEATFKTSKFLEFNSNLPFFNIIL